jgi:hypothetical protein
MIERILSVDFAELAGIVREIIADPTSNIEAAWLLLAVVTLLVILVFMVALWFVIRRGEDETTAPGEETDFASADDDGYESFEGEGDEHEPVEPSAGVAPLEGTSATPRPARAGAGALYWIGILLVLWLVTGYTTSLPYVCASCHTGGPHGVASVTSDPHRALACLACHESGGALAPVSTGVPARVAHLVTGIAGGSAYPYGPVSNSACLACHRATATTPSVVASLGVRVSHAEPLAAGAACTDCHRLAAGRIGPVEAAMDTCIRCHDAKVASADCSVCHVADVSVAVNGGVRSPASASVLVPTPDCGGCHEQTKCDRCHGIRLPHTPQFVQYAHARAYVENLWFGDGRLCTRCHTVTRRPCSKCHGTPMPAHGKSLAKTHRLADPAGKPCVGCHNRPFLAGRDFCADLCHRPGQTSATR